MKKDLGKIPALYPVPAVVLGAMDGEKPSWTLAAHLGTVGHDRLMISLVKSHYINELIKKTGKVTVNLVSEEMLPEADAAGSASGRTKDKSGLFEWSGDAVIDNAPLSILCTLEQIVETPGFENMICRIDSTLAEENVLSEQGKIDYDKAAPILFEFPGYTYMKTGGTAGKCLQMKPKDLAFPDRKAEAE